MTESRHVVARESQGVVQAAQRQLYVVAPFALEFPKRLKTALAILAVRGDGKVEIASETPKGVVFGLMQPFARGKKRIAHRYRAQFHHGAARFLDHLAHIRARQNGHELEPSAIDAAI